MYCPHSQSLNGGPQQLQAHPLKFKVSFPAAGTDHGWLNLGHVGRTLQLDWRINPSGEGASSGLVRCLLLELGENKAEWGEKPQLASWVENGRGVSDLPQDIQSPINWERSGRC